MTVRGRRVGPARDLQNEKQWQSGKESIPYTHTHTQPYKRLAERAKPDDETRDDDSDVRARPKHIERHKTHQSRTVRQKKASNRSAISFVISSPFSFSSLFVLFTGVAV